MKKINIAFIIFCCTFFVAIFNSCDDDDGYSLGDVYGGLATVKPLGDNSFYLVLDNGTTLWPAAPYPYNPKQNQRTVAYFTILGEKIDGYDYYVKIRALNDILTKGVIDLTEENADSIGNDPIRIFRYWEGDDYLNIEFGYNRGGEKVHFINMVNNTTATIAEDGKIHLEFRHNANGDPQKNGVKGLVAFDLRPYKETNKESVEFVIKVKDFDGEKEYQFTYKYADKNAKNTNIDLSNYETTQYK